VGNSYKNDKTDYCYTFHHEEDTSINNRYEIDNNFFEDFNSIDGSLIDNFDDNNAFDYKFTIEYTPKNNLDITSARIIIQYYFGKLIKTIFSDESIVTDDPIDRSGTIDCSEEQSAILEKINSDSSPD